MFFRWIFSALIFVAILLPATGQKIEADERSQSTPRTAGQIRQHLEAIGAKKQGYTAWAKESRAFVGSLSLEEVKLYVLSFPQHLRTDLGEMMIEHWAFLDHTDIVKKFGKDESRVIRLEKEAGQGLEGNLAEALLSREWGLFDAMMRGWSRRDPRSAWEAVKKPDGLVSNLEVFEGSFGYLTLQPLMEGLARIEPKRVWTEYENYPKMRYDWVNRDSMLKGISDGLPEGSNWQVLLEKVIVLSSSDLDHLSHTIMEYLFSRWLAEDPTAAEQWFRSERAGAISTEMKEMSLDSRFFRFLTGGRLDGKINYAAQIPMGPAIVRWMFRDFEGALVWLSKRKEKTRDFLERECENLRHQVSEENVRKLMVTCYSVGEREEILHNLLQKDSSSSNPFSMFCEVKKKEKMRKALSELEISSHLIEQIIEKIREGYLLDDDE